MERTETLPSSFGPEKNLRDCQEQKLQNSAFLDLGRGWGGATVKNVVPLRGSKMFILEIQVLLVDIKPESCGCSGKIGFETFQNTPHLSPEGSGDGIFNCKADKACKMVTFTEYRMASE